MESNQTRASHNERKNLTLELKPISKENFEKLSPRRTDYTPIVEEFLKGDDDIMEVILEPNRKPQTTYQSLKSHSQRLGYPFLVRRREDRIFILKVNSKKEK